MKKKKKKGAFIRLLFNRLVWVWTDENFHREQVLVKFSTWSHLATTVDTDGFMLVWCCTVEVALRRKEVLTHWSPVPSSGAPREEGGFQRNIYSDLFLSLARGPWELSGEDKQWTIEFRDEQQCQHSMGHWGMSTAGESGGEEESTPGHLLMERALLLKTRKTTTSLFNFNLLAVNWLSLGASGRTLIFLTETKLFFFCSLYSLSNKKHAS